jgi:hypothetical protein
VDTATINLTLTGQQLQADYLGGGVGGGHTIQDEGVNKTQRTNLNFVGGTVVVTDDAGNDATVVTVSNNPRYIDQAGGTGDTYGILAGIRNGVNVDFTVSQGAYTSGALSVYLNGQLQTQGTAEDWHETNPASGTFQFTTAPSATDEITVIYGGVVIGSVGITGTYTPTLYNISNIAASTAKVCQWVRIGDKVIVSGGVDVDTTTTGVSSIGMSLPIASNLASIDDLSGSGAAVEATESIKIEADTANDRASFWWQAVAVSNHTIKFMFMYQIL